MLRIGDQAPEWQVSEWLNSRGPLSLEALRGRVIALHAFQMLCPGCVSHGLPQSQKIASAFPEVAVIGIHTVFEHHDAMTPTALKAFLSEYRIRFPVAIDEPGEQKTPIPKTMAAYGLEGTPSLVLIDRNGILRERIFGRADDMIIGAKVAELQLESQAEVEMDHCSNDSCSLQRVGR